MSEPAAGSEQPARIYQLIADRIEDSILAGHLQPGDRLPSERELVIEYGVSRPTVREALRVLESGYLVKSRHGDRRGPVVLPLSSHSLQKALTRLTMGSALSFEALLQFRMVIDSAAANLAAHNRTAAELLELERANARMRVSLDSQPATFSEADFAFHSVIAKASRNPLFELAGRAVRDSVLVQMRRRIEDAPNSQVQMQNSIRHHDEVLKAIRDADGTRASWLTRDAIYWYYHDYVDSAHRSALRSLVDEVNK
ncbi:FadR/GntR family transcriptional regulator [Rhodococcus sp. NPDC079359]|uniref:FadR/GntR family transcriptional regulator n=1 Tax=Rhodococcus sp. NPDC079359 TaxID=3154961 RepID=UPI00344C2A03